MFTSLKPFVCDFLFKYGTDNKTTKNNHILVRISYIPLMEFYGVNLETLWHWANKMIRMTVKRRG